MLTSLAIVVLAGSSIRVTDSPDLLGWSKDGAHLVWTVTDEEFVPKEADSEEYVLSQVAKIAVVYDIARAERTQYLLSIKKVRKDATGKVRPMYGTPLPAADFEAWKKANPIVSLKGQSGPGGAKASFLVQGEPATEWEPEDTIKLTMIVAKGADRASTTIEDGPEAMFRAQRWLAVFWDPTGRRVLFMLVTAAATTMRGTNPASADLHILTVPPRIDVVSSERIKTEAHRAATALEKAGFVISSMGIATADRTGTVIYAGAAHQELAKKLAAALPGATIDKLTWKPNAEVVVAVGAPK